MDYSFCLDSLLIEADSCSLLGDSGRFVIEFGFESELFVWNFSPPLGYELALQTLGTDVE